MATQIRIIRVKVDAGDSTKELKAIQGSLSKMNKEIGSVSAGLKSFQNAFQFLAGASVLGVGIGQITNLADSYGLLFDRIKVLTGSAENAKQVFTGISTVAESNKGSIEGVATVYARLAAATNDLGLSQNQVLKVSDLLLKTFRISGATTSEATSSTIQLAQGLASGALRGQELRSVLEANVEFGRLLSKEFGITRGELIKLGEDGKITADRVLKALINSEDELIAKNKELGITFEQVGIQLENELLVAVGELSKELDLAGKLSKGIDYLIESIPQLSLAIGGATAAMIAFQAASVSFMRVALIIGGALSTPLAIATAVGAAIFVIAKNFDEIVVRMKNTAAEFASGILNIIAIPFQKIPAIINPLKSMIEDLDRTVVDNTLSLKKGGEEVDQYTFRLRDFQKETIASIPVQEKKKKKINETQVALAALNKEFNAGKINLAEYNQRLGKIEMKRLNIEMKEGKINFIQFQEKVRDALKNTPELFDNAYLSLQALNAVLDGNKIEQLNQKFVEGKISVDEYNRSIIQLSSNFMPSSALYVGTADFLNNIGTVSQNVAGLVTTTFGRLEDALVEFTTKGKFNFKEFSMAVIEDINRIILRAMVIRPLAEGIIGAFGSSSQALPSGTQTLDASASFGTMAAKGYAPTGSGVTMFAKGGIVNGATPFTYGGSKKGIMGEAGPEAIIPLKRGADGSLGVQASPSNVVVNIVNQAGTEVEQTESTQPDGTRVIDVLITSRVKEGMARGDYDRTLAQAFGITRKGR